LLGITLVWACAQDGARRLGDLCGRDSECAAGRCDELVCKSAVPRGTGEPCEHPLQCRSERCLEGACSAGVRGPGAPCSDPLQCASGQCAAGRCVDSATDGGGHDAGTDGRADGDARADTDAGEAGDSGAAPPWPRRFGGAGADVLAGLAIDGNGNLYLAGRVAGEVDFGGELLQAAGTALASYTATGVHRWSRAFEGINAYDLAVDAAGNATITGEFWNPIVSLGGGPLYNEGNGDIFVAGFTADGDLRWSSGFGGTSKEIATGVALDSQANVYLGGDFYSDGLDFGGGPLTPAQPPPPQEKADLFIVSFTSAGAHRWSQSFGTTADEIAHDIAIGGGDRVYLAGMYANGVDLGGGALPWVGTFDAFLASFDASGAHRWSRGFAADNYEEGWALAADNAGQVYLAGSFVSSTLDLGGGALTNPGLLSAYCAVFDADGAHHQSAEIGSVA
jgi:hypothetical protein